MKSIFRSLVLAACLATVANAQAQNVPRCASGMMECEYIPTYGWYCYCV